MPSEFLSGQLSLMRSRLPVLGFTLLLSALGTLPRLLESPSLLAAVVTVLLMLVPSLVIGSFSLLVTAPAPRWGSALGTGLAAAVCNFVLLDPQYNQDANIGLGLYWIGGFVVMLGLPALLGALLGRLLSRRRE